MSWINLGYILIGMAIGVMVQCFDWETEGGKVNMEDASGRAFLALAILLIVLHFLVT